MKPTSALAQLLAQEFNLKRITGEEAASFKHKEWLELYLTAEEQIGDEMIEIV